MSPSDLHDHDAYIMLCKLGQGLTQRLIVGRAANGKLETVRASDWDADWHASPTMWVRLLAVLATLFNRK